MKYCSECGSEVSLKIPAGDSRERHVCDSCGLIHYLNPRIIAGTLPVYEDKILLCKRAIEPRRGYWTLPAGFMENGETTAQAAARETIEEAEANVNIHGLYTVFNLPHISQVYMFFRSDVIDGHFGVGEESLETQLFDEADIPWDELAFPTIHRTLKLYFEDRKTGHYPVRLEDIQPRVKKS
ncbi:NUDIX hydrolase [Ketobacter sp. MCCC 1A13808]|uniref:NUDIX hydrolase n=1 Tax=Ketobacter sp. MCCC 1A13808 TaxID=2602738 RepID=UPI000F17600C|nr:NUDIX hydrolase [Ketobacter sp. MCCC 1A13808]MVF14181.1 NUDIX hydrolase [Ketobacter sp. MCCC 1A13808]RLP54088.1 MAG: NUDIX domain-containing protein [Ketobacter sp.]